MTRFGWMAALLLGCSDKDEGNGDSAPDIDIDPISCHKTNPVIGKASLANTGIQSTVDEGKVATWTIILDVTDEDGELSDYDVHASFDPKVDGKVVPDAFNTFVRHAEDQGDACEVTTAHVEYVIPVTKEFIAFDTHYEWGLVVYDAGDGASEMVVVEGYSPNKDGSDGGP